MVTCWARSGEPSGVWRLPRARQLSPTRPSARSRTASSSTRRRKLSGRQAISSTVPSSRGERRMWSSPASRARRLRCSIAPSVCPAPAPSEARRISRRGLCGDGLSMGTEGMRASLISREVIADSVELMVHAERLDGVVTIAGCDKSLPGMVMAAVRLNLPTVFLYGGTIMPGRFHARDVTIQDVFEGVGAHAAGRMSDEELHELESSACPGAGSCAGHYTANTMAAAVEALGLSLPGSATPPAISERRAEAAFAAGMAVVEQLRTGLLPSDIVTRRSLENAIAVVMATGGSTNAVLHLLAIAHEVGVPLELDDFDAISRRVPHIADLRPAGRFVMADFDRVGGVQVVIRELLEAGLLHGDARSVNGMTLAENVASAPD